MTLSKVFSPTVAEYLFCLKHVILRETRELKAIPSIPQRHLKRKYLSVRIFLGMDKRKGCFAYNEKGKHPFVFRNLYVYKINPMALLFQLRFKVNKLSDITNS